MPHDQPRPIRLAARGRVVVVELAVGAVRRSVAGEHCGRAEERRDEVTREARSNRARRVLLERAACDRALEVAAKATRHPGANELAMLALVRDAVSRTGTHGRRERPLVDPAKAEGPVAVVVNLVGPLLGQRRPRADAVAAIVRGREREAELVLALCLAFAARIGEAGRRERQNPDEQDERNDQSAHLFPPLLLGIWCP